MKVVFTAPARNALRRLPADRRRQIITRIEALASGQSDNLDVKRLQGSDVQRLRVGQYRVLFGIDQANQIITVELIRTRGDIYKR